MGGNLSQQGAHQPITTGGGGAAGLGVGIGSQITTKFRHSASTCNYPSYFRSSAGGVTSGRGHVESSTYDELSHCTAEARPLDGYDGPNDAGGGGSDVVDDVNNNARPPRKSNSFFSSLKKLSLYTRLRRDDSGLGTDLPNSIRSSLRSAKRSCQSTGKHQNDVKGSASSANHRNNNCTTSANGVPVSSCTRISRIRRVLSFSGAPLENGGTSHGRSSSHAKSNGAVHPVMSTSVPRLRLDLPLKSDHPGQAQAQSQYCRSAALCMGLKSSLPSTPSGSGKRTILQASTSELLRCIGQYLVIKCPRIFTLEVLDPILWIKGVDRSLILQGWQEMGFVNPANIVFLYMLVKDCIDENLSSENELRIHLLTCLYISYAYCGHEISYPLKPFILELDRSKFWRRVIGVVNRMSQKMLKVHEEQAYFTHLFIELKGFQS